MKPDWKDAPDWANWLAMDKDGTWVWYAKQPAPFEKSGMWDTLMSQRQTYKVAQLPKDWKETIEQRPDNE